MNYLGSRLARFNLGFTRRPRSAFTLIELLTVIAIIGILAAIIIPTVGQVRKTAKSAQCISNLRQIGMGFNLYPTDNKGRFPRADLNPRNDNPAVVDARWYVAITPYVQTGNVRVATSMVFRCPSEEAVVDPARINTVVQYAVSLATERTGSVGATGRAAKPEDIPNLSKTFLVVDGKVNTTGAGSGVIIGTSIYGYTADIVPSIASTPAASTRVAFRHGDGVNALYADGHTARLTFDAFKKELADPIVGRKLWDPFAP